MNRSLKRGEIGSKPGAWVGTLLSWVFTVGDVRLLMPLIVASTLSCAPAFSQRPKVLLDDKKATVTFLELRSGERFALPSDQPGAVWIALDAMMLSKGKRQALDNRLMSAGHAEFIHGQETVSLAPGSQSSARLIVVIPKRPTQALTLLPFLTDRSEEDASDRGATLIVAISSCRFRDTQDIGDESQWIPSKPQVIALNSGEVKWIVPGIHHFKNLGPSKAKLISIEF